MFYEKLLLVLIHTLRTSAVSLQRGEMGKGPSYFDASKSTIMIKQNSVKMLCREIYLGISEGHQYLRSEKFIYPMAVEHLVSFR